MPTTAEPAYLSVSEAARILGLSEGTIYRRVWDGSLPVVRLSENGAIRIPRGAIEDRGRHNSQGVGPENPASAPRTGLTPAVEAPAAHGGDTREAA